MTPAACRTSRKPWRTDHARSLAALECSSSSLNASKSPSGIGDNWCSDEHISRIDGGVQRCPDVRNSEAKQFRSQSRLEYPDSE